MSYTVVVTAEAHDETVVAYQYYEEQQAGLGERFLDALNDTYQSLEQHPAYYGYIAEDPQQVFRDVRVKKFPYVVVYEIREETVIVYAVFHTRRHPDSKI